jgi:hypothetical protein
MKRTFKEFQDQWEQAANSVGGGGVSMPADAVHDKKKKKKDIYDGRTKAGRKFIERILSRRKASEVKEEVNEAYKFDKNDFRYWRSGGMELKLRNGAYGHDVEQAFKKAGYDVYGKDVDINRDSIKFNSYSKHWGTDDKKIRKVVLKVLGVDIERL